MKAEQQKDLLKALRPVLRDRQKAERILQRFWSTRMALIWTVMDVHRAANERGLVLTAKEAESVLQELEHNHNKQYGIKWSDVTDLIHDKVLGREITKQELKKFLVQDIIAIQQPKKK